ncbi:MAG: methylamine utilization protein [Steroidobacteraceae bacterium]
MKWTGVNPFTLLLVACCGAICAQAGDLHIVITDGKQNGMGDVVVIATPLGAGAALPKPSAAPATMDQRNLEFVPHVLVVRTGTLVSFPNHDVVRHQVYSFSPAKAFQLPLYAGKIYPPLLFDKAGIVTIGCNIHDSMVGFIFVTDSPWFARSSAAGVADIAQLPAGEYAIELWHPRQSDPLARLRGKALVDASGVTSAQFTLPSLRAAPNNNPSKKWAY